MSITEQEWSGHQHFESDWWGDCANTFGEDMKHPTYARLMGMQMTNDGGRIGIDMPGMSIVDYGGGPSSMLLKTRGAAMRVVVDPCPYPQWTRDRYAVAGVDVVQAPGERFVTTSRFDEAWCYNVLQHVQDPALVIENMRKSAKLIRLFEWIDLPPHEGHPHMLTTADILGWVDGVRIPVPEMSYWSEVDVGWDHWIGRTPTPYRAFAGYTKT